MSGDFFRIIDIGLGLILVYLALSVVVTAMTETVAGFLKLRAGMLAKGVRWLLQGAASDMAARNAPAGSPDHVAQQLMAHPMINGATSGPSPASHIPPRIFALTLLDVLHKVNEEAGRLSKPPTDPSFTFADAQQLVASLPDSDLKNTLALVLADAQRRTVAAEDAIAQWYDAGMQRVSNWYKKRIQTITLVLGIVVAATVNANTIHIAEVLWQDDIARHVTLDAATKMAVGTEPGAGCSPVKDLGETTAIAQAISCRTEAAMEAFTAVGSLPIGWSQDIDQIGRQKGWITLILGWLITGFALQMGAPFWFNLLQKLVKMRASFAADGTTQGGTQPPPQTYPPAPIIAATALTPVMAAPNEPPPEGPSPAGQPT